MLLTSIWIGVATIVILSIVIVGVAIHYSLKSPVDPDEKEQNNDSDNPDDNLGRGDF